MITSRGLIQGLAALLIGSAPAFAEFAPNPRIDRALSQSLREGGATQRVIISVKPGHRAEIRQALEKHGDRIRSEHPFIDALAGDIHSDDVSDLANHPWVLAASIDATVYAGGVAGVAASAGVGAAIVPGGAVDTAPANTLRQTLGLPKSAGALTPSSSGVGVAIIDSGIAPLDDFAGRITGFYDFTRGNIPVAPFDDYGHGTHVAGLIGSSGLLSNNQFQGVAPNVGTRRFEGARPQRRRADERRHSRHRVRDGQPGDAQGADHQPVLRSPDFRAGEGRSDGAGGGEGLRSRTHRCCICIVWGTLDGDHIVWGTVDGDNIVWGTGSGDNIVWGTSRGDNIVWGSSREEGDNIVWGNRSDGGDNIVRGAQLVKGGSF